jgi:hypothetical protein
VFSGVIDPRIVPARNVEGSRTVEREFDFEDTRVRLRVPVDEAVYVGAMNAEKSTMFIGGARPPDWVGDHYRAFVTDKHQEPFYAALSDSLHQVRDEEKLDASRYVELVTAMVQALEYRVDTGDLAPKFPIETYGDGYGDCDDKALLAAGLLARDGYDVALLLFEQEKHVALGIKAPGLDYKGTGYAFVEATSPSLVGVPTDTLEGGIELASTPAVIKVGEGTLTYEAGPQVTEITRRTKKLRERAKELKTQMERDAKKLEERRAKLESSRPDAYATSDPAAAANAIASFNREVDAYNRAVQESNALVARYNALVETEKYVAEHQTDRRKILKRLEKADL